MRFRLEMRLKKKLYFLKQKDGSLRDWYEFAKMENFICENLNANVLFFIRSFSREKATRTCS